RPRNRPALTATVLAAGDRAQLAERGIPVAEAERQLALLARPAGHVELDRPCTIGDGIERLSETRVDALLATHAKAAATGRVSAFVPASGAATRMFRELVAVRERKGELGPRDARASVDANERALAAFVDALPRLALADPLGAILAARGQ